MDKRIVIFLAVAFGGSWVTWAVAGVLTGAFAAGIESSAAMVAVVALTMFLPLVGALAANAAVPAGERVKLCLRLRLRGNGRLYACAWLAPAALTLLGSALFFCVFPQLFDAEGTRLRAALAEAGMPADRRELFVAAQVAAALTVAPLANALPALGEEAGWRGLLLPALCARMSERRAVVATGVIWGLWHAPIIAMGHNFGRDYLGFPWVGILAMVVACTSVGCLFAWLRLRAGSVWPCALAHGALNAVANVGTSFCTVLATPLGPSPLGLVAGIPTLLLAVACWRQLSAQGPQDVRETLIHG